MPNTNLFEQYLAALRQTAIDQKTEHTDRGPLETLLRTLAHQTSHDINIQHEPKRAAEKGAPDFKVTAKGSILGYVENKLIGEALEKVLKSPQIAKYKTLSQNIILTDYLHFIWISKNGIQRETLLHATDLENRKFKLHPDRIDAVTTLFKGFFSTPPDGISRSETLALALAQRSQLLRDFLAEELVRQQASHKEGRLYGLFDVFKQQIFHELTLKEFADAFAQMLAYGLFLARLNSVGAIITLHNARQFVPGSFRLIQELVEFLSELEKEEYRDVRWVVEEVLSIVNNLNLPAIHEDLSFRQRKAVSRKVRAADEEEHRLFERDPFIYFYEDYLKAYDKATRKARGVYYTPPPIVNFIVRAIDDILKDSFGIKDGLADHDKVTVLDFACGTGTFLLEIFQRIFDNIGGPGAGKAASVVREHMLARIFGFEYLIAPYTIAHLKLSQYLKDQGHPLQGGERLQVYLTNTLEPVEPQGNLLLPAITAEVKAAQDVKDRKILVITGNPPYSAHSRNTGTWIKSAIDAYKYIDGVHFGERKHWLHDDYVKFIRFAQWKMERAETGIVGIITNHSWLDNPTFRAMRFSLMKTFDQIYVIDLHGNTKKREISPDGSLDTNIFDIEQGVAISLFIKKAGLEKGVWRGDIWGTRLSKYKAAAAETIAKFGWKRLRVDAPDYLFIETGKLSHKRKYNKYWSLPEIFRDNSPGIITARDGFALSFTRTELIRRVSRLIASDDSDSALRREFGLDDTRGWSLKKSRKSLREGPDWKRSIKLMLQAPFDLRHIPYDPRLIDWGRWKFIARLPANSLSISVPRKIDIQRPWEHIFAVEGLSSHHAVSMKEVNYLFPLIIDKSENYAPDFRKFIDGVWDHHYTPEEIFGYIYAVLHAPTYRKRYAEFLRLDFPRIPFPKSSNNFEKLSRLGWALVQAHLLLELPRRNLGQYYGKGENAVEVLRYSPAHQTVSINETQSFKPISEDVWNFHVGGYQVLKKYLDSRRKAKRTLSLDEINHVAKVADSVAFTIAQMAAIDRVYLQAFDNGDK